MFWNFLILWTAIIDLHNLYMEKSEALLDFLQLTKYLGRKKGRKNENKKERKKEWKKERKKEERKVRKKQ